jgi:plastocyanin
MSPANVKPGDRVVHTNFESGEGTVTTDPTPGPLGLVVDVQWDEPARHLLSNPNRHQVSLLRHVPASLDRSKVKPGDTVTVRVEEEYAHTKHPAYTISDTTAYGDPVMVGPFVLDQEHITLLDHQPAPEPEPEWKPGTLYAAASADGPVRLYRNKGIDRDYWLDAGGEMVPDEAVSKVRPLAVIDPDDVDVVALQREIDDAMPGHEASVALGHLGLTR